MINLTFELYPLQIERAQKLLSNRRLLGDMFNGWFKGWLIDEHLHLQQALRPVTQDQALYALRILPDPKRDLSLTACITLIGSAALYANQLLSALANNPVVSLGPPQTEFELTGFAASQPGTSSQILMDEQTSLIEPIPDKVLDLCLSTAYPELTSAQSITLDFYTPHRLGQCVAGAAPTLKAITKNIAVKLRALEPQTADHIGLETQAWYTAERALNNVQVVTDTRELVTWQYRSENQYQHRRMGWLGTVQFAVVGAAIPAAVVQVLWLGQWLSSGQNCIGGQGCYDLRRQ